MSRWPIPAWVGRKWVVKSASYNYGQSGWFAYREGDFERTAVHLDTWSDAIGVAHSKSVADRLFARVKRERLVGW